MNSTQNQRQTHSRTFNMPPAAPNRQRAPPLPPRQPNMKRSGGAPVPGTGGDVDPGLMLLWQLVRTTCSKLTAIGYNHGPINMRKRLHCRHLLADIQQVTIQRMEEKKASKRAATHGPRLTVNTPEKLSIVKERRHSGGGSKERRSSREVHLSLDGGDNANPVDQKEKQSTRKCHNRRRSSSTGSSDGEDDCPTGKPKQSLIKTMWRKGVRRLSGSAPVTAPQTQAWA
eukprot:m.9626 g.9626  ORF g.9626 m.9626 type:complete len:228 (-) comp6969_c0_seq1:123-806(-)